MSNNDWTNKLREQLADYQEPVGDDLWADIEQSLAQQQQEQTSVQSNQEQADHTVRPHTARQIFIRRFSIAENSSLWLMAFLVSCQQHPIFN